MWDLLRDTKVGSDIKIRIIQQSTDEDENHIIIVYLLMQEFFFLLQNLVYIDDK